MRLWAACSVLAALFYGAPAAAVTITGIAYDAAEDRLVMSIAYRGTNPNHQFSLQWTGCKRLDGQRRQILGLLVDTQPDDLARQEFIKPLEIGLSSFTCRPAKVTIRTSAGFFTSVDVPARPPKKSEPSLSDSEARNAASN